MTAVAEVESGALAECERIIERGLATFVEVGRALLRIRDERLYRAEHPTFEAYCLDRWSMTPQHGNRLIAAAEVVGQLEPIGCIVPTTESQARELARVPAAERAEVWAETVAETDGRPTAAAVREVAQRRAPRPLPISPEEIDALQVHNLPPLPPAAPSLPAQFEAELDAVMEGTPERFVHNLTRAIQNTHQLTRLNPDRAADLGDELQMRDTTARLRAWCDAVDARLRRQRLTLVGGGQ